jgi:hypothetical protein
MLTGNRSHRTQRKGERQGSAGTKEARERTESSLGAGGHPVGDGMCCSAVIIAQHLNTPSKGAKIQSLENKLIPLPPTCTCSWRWSSGQGSDGAAGRTAQVDRDWRQFGDV